MDEVVVVGAGIGGLGAALMLADGGASVTVLDGASEVGGLLKSRVCSGASFDLGTHFIIGTQDAEVDGLFIEPLREYTRLLEFRSSLLEGHFLRGRLNDSTGCPDLRFLPPERLDAARAELLRATQSVDRAAGDQTAESFVLGQYGPTILREFYEPAVSKLAGHPLEALEPSVISLFHFPRVVLFESSTARFLKEFDSAWDRRLAYAKIDDAHSLVPKYYPRDGGVSEWPNVMRLRAEAAGVRFKLGSPVESISVKDDHVVRVETREGSFWSPDLVVWTVAPELALRSAGEDPPGGPPAFRDVQLLHFISREAYCCRSFWISNYDPDFLSYRTTLYDNFAGNGARSGFRLTVEVLSDPGADPVDSRTIQEELRLQGILSENAVVEEVGRETLARALPIPLVGAQNARAAALRRTAGLAKNFVLAGSGNGAGSQVAILRDVFRTMNRL